MRNQTKLFVAGMTLLLAQSGTASAAVGAATAPSAGITDGGAPHAMVDAGPPETSDQRAYRMKYVSDTAAKENALMHGLVWTPEVRKAEGAHWRRAYRTLRIRELAEDGGDTATMARTDLFLRKIDGHFFAFMSETAPNLPTQPAAPALAAPSANTTIPIGSAVTITMTPGANVTANEYYCVLSEGTAGMSNYDPVAKHYGTSPTCTFAANDPRWAKFTAKKGGVWVMTATKATSPKGVVYNQWSHQAYVPVMMTGGAQ